MSFKALVTNQQDGSVSAAITTLDETQLPAGDVEVAIEYSTINYKDGLVVTSGGGLVKNYPHIPGIDFAGKVSASTHASYKVGDNVVLTGWRVGEIHWGGYAQKARVKGDWLVALPSGLSSAQAMAIGTAGFTAMLAVMALEAQGVTPNSGPILVTGAGGGVGSVAIAILASLGYTVTASTGRLDLTDYLTQLGATQVIDRSVFAEPAKRPLESEAWAGVIDSVGGNTLARALAQLKYNGVIASVGLAQGAKFEATVIPFLLRGAKLIGIDSVMCPLDKRRQAWSRISQCLEPKKLASMTQTIPLNQVPEYASHILKGQVKGRVVVDVNA
jgi:acrylyl-CoA reductase (NADPH)